MAGKELKNFHLDMLEVRRKVCSFEFSNFNHSFAGSIDKKSLNFENVLNKNRIELNIYFLSNF